MRYFIALFYFTFFFAGHPVAAIELPVQNGLFSDDLSQCDKRFDKLTSLEQLVEAASCTHGQLLAGENPLAHCLRTDGDLGSSLLGGAPDPNWFMGIPGFLWGFCCSALGVLIVLFSFDDPEIRQREGKQAIIGCAVGTLIWLGLYLWLLLVNIN